MATVIRHEVGYLTSILQAMMSSLERDFEYQVGGSLGADSPSYVKRQADQALYTMLKAGHFAYVFNSRQMGKSSLRVRTMQHLKADDICCIALDMTRIGSEHLTPQQWYTQVISEFWRGANLLTQVNLKTWLHDHHEMTCAPLLFKFMDEVLLTKIQQPIVIFIDEIDSTLSLNFPINDFFALIRACYNHRVDDLKYRRLTFCLLGVATPSDLITDKTRTPFNIGRAIAFNGFTRDEAKGLTRGLMGCVANPKDTLQEILHWTGGQPFLTQKLCQLATELIDQSIESIVQTHLIDHWESQDEPAHLRTIRDRLLQDDQRTNRLLGLYQQILEQGDIPADDSEGQMELRLSGLVVKGDNGLRVYNLIYAAVFNADWVGTQLDRLRPYAEAFKAWTSSDCTDESRLLRGQALDEALQWAAGRSLSSQDTEFLRASQQFENQETKQANNILAAANREAKRQIRIATAFLGTAIFAAAATGIWIKWSRSQALDLMLLERSGESVLQESKSDYPTRALSHAMHTAYRLQQLTGEQNIYHTTSPIIALQTILANIQAEVFYVFGVSLHFSEQGTRVITRNSNNFIVRDSQGNQLSSLNEVPPRTTPLFSPDGDRILVAEYFDSYYEYSLQHDEEDRHDPVVQLWDAQGTYLATLDGHAEHVTVAAFSPNSQYVATGSDDGKAILWNTNGEQIATLSDQSEPIRHIQFSADSNRIGIISGSTGDIAHVWDVKGRQEAEFYGPNSPIDMTLNPALDHILTTEEEKVRLWDIQGNELAIFPGYSENLGSANATFSPDGSLIAAYTDRTHTVNVWNLQGNQLGAFPSTQDFIKDIEFSPDGRQVAIAEGVRNSTGNNIVTLWNLSGNLVKHLNVKRSLNSIRFSPDGQRIAVETERADRISRRTVSLWHLDHTGAIAFDGQHGPVKMMQISPDGTHIAVLGTDHVTRIYDHQGNQRSAFKGHDGEVKDIQFSSQGNHLLTNGYDVSHDRAEASIRVWSLEGEQLAILEGGWKLDWDNPISQDGDYTATFSHDESTGDEIIHIWTLNGDRVSSIQDFDNIGISALRFSPDGRHFAVGLTDQTARLFDMQGNHLAILGQHNSWVEDVVFNADSDRILTFSTNTHLWDLQGNKLATLDNIHLGSPNTLVRTSGDRFIPSGSRLSLWSFQGDQPTVLSPSNGWFSANKETMQMSDNGTRIAALGNVDTLGNLANIDYPVRVWDDHGNQLAEYNGYAMALSSDGNQIAVVSNEDHIPRLFPIDDLDSLLSKGCDWIRLHFVVYGTETSRQMCNVAPN